MSEHDISDREAVKFLPRVSILIASDNQEVIDSAENQNYAKKHISRQVCIGNNIPEWYNDSIGIVRAQTDIFVFLNDNVWLSNTNSVERIVEKFLLEKMGYPLIYTDSYRVEENYLAEEYLPPFSPALFAGNQMINNPIAVQAQFLPENPFNEKLETLYFFDVMRKMSNRFLLCHIPEPIFTLKRLPFNIQQEVAILSG